MRALGAMTTDQQNCDDSLQLIQNYLDDFNNSLNPTVYAGSYTLKSKLPWKADSIRELLFHRVTDIANSALGLVQNNSRVPAVMLVRSLMETTAMVYSLHLKTNTFLSDSNEIDFDDFLMKALLGSRDETTDITSVNILTMIDKVNREFDGFRAMYDGLCEYTHPNWRGVMLSYSQIDRDNFTTHLGPVPTEPASGVLLGPFVASLSIFKDVYDQTGNEIEEINKRFEN